MKQRMIDVKRARSAVLSVVCLCAAMAACGQESAASAPRAEDASEVGHASRALLALQRESTSHGGALPMLGAEASRAYRRYLKSFETPIPAEYRSAVGSMSGGNGGSGAGGSGLGDSAALSAGTQ
jgi:hypothetical protein